MTELLPLDMILSQLCAIICNSQIGIVWVRKKFEESKCGQHKSGMVPIRIR